MNLSYLKDILPLVEQPGRYLGLEVNAQKKDPKSVKLNMALAFPDLYEIGSSHFGMQILYHIINNYPDAAAERVFAPAQDMEALLRSHKVLLCSLESKTPLQDFDIIGFSLLYELNFTNILTILDLAGIPFHAAEREHSHPLIIGGGPCTCNPEPVADFFDAIVIGDGEIVIQELMKKWMEWDKTNKKDLLKEWSQIDGVYIPSFFEPYYENGLSVDTHGRDSLLGNSNGFQKLKPVFSDYTMVKRTIIPDLDTAPFPDKPIVPFGKPVHDRLNIEIARGCTRGCRFCQAGMIYRPVRERSMGTILNLAEKALAATGYKDLSLMSLSTGDYACIAPLMKALIEKYKPENISISLPSLRAGTLTPMLMELIKKIRKTGFTIAPEAGSQRLRDVINKNITEQEIFDTVSNAFTMGWQVIKLYFMIGLPTETEEDLTAIVNMVKRMRQIKIPNSRQGKINVSISTFIPKPHTPFQWERQISMEESREKQDWLKDNLKIRGVQLKWHHSEMSFLEGIWARGDRRLSAALIEAYKLGCRFDGWTDKFNFNKWEQAFNTAQTDLDFYTIRERRISDSLPWDHIDTGISKKFLIKELEKAIKASQTEDCRTEECNKCGVCDFKCIQPMVFKKESHDKLNSRKQDKIKPVYKKIEISYSKQGLARYFGHLEMVNIFLRAFNRAGISFKFSEGFHPMPKVSFSNPLPIGMESLKEKFIAIIKNSIIADDIINILNKELPSGLNIYAFKAAPPKSKKQKVQIDRYEIKLTEGVFDPEKLKEFKEIPISIIYKTGKKGKTKEINLKEIISDISLIDSDRLKMTLCNKEGKTARPAEILKKIFDLSDKTIKRARVVKH
ncbi:TIGR03960 family B12-binding radical SAM protein [Candidatus Magnetomoraceae bacterium gMMP-1]